MAACLPLKHFANINNLSKQTKQNEKYFSF
nr:MAG TPA: hypothetical protein [Caudoviricetes sp.]